MFYKLLYMCVILIHARLVQYALSVIYVTYTHVFVNDFVLFKCKYT